MAALILLNGPPAVGKSTLAELLVARRPFALHLDIDVIRSHLGGWLDDPHAAGLTARTLAIAMIEAHLGADHDVVVPQFLAQPDFIDTLAGVAVAADAPFVDIALDVPRSEAIAAFAERSARPTAQTHIDAAALVAQSDVPGPVGAMYDALDALLAGRPDVRRVPVTRGDVDATLDDVVEAIAAAGVRW